jgi:hypothetical protein
LYSTKAASATVAAISAGLNSKIDSINIVAGSNVTVVQNPSKTWTISSVGGGGNSWLPVAGLGMTITAPTSSTYLFSVTDYIGKTEVADISAGLQSQINNIVIPSVTGYATTTQVTQLSGYVNQNTNSINDLYATKAASTTVAAISAGLQSQINNIVIPNVTGFATISQVASISAVLNTQVTQLSGYVLANTNSINDLYATRATSSTVQAISGGLQTQITQISGYVNQNTNSINTLFSTYANTTTVAAISAGLNTQVTQLSGYVNQNTNSINTLFSTYANTTTVAAISAGLNSKVVQLSGYSLANSNSINTLFNTYTNSSTTQAISAGLMANIAYSTQRNMKTYTQNSHGFTNGNILAYNGTNWVLAQANTPNNSEAIGIVEDYTANTFNLVSTGYINLYSQTLTPGSIYFVSDITAGLLSINAPTANGAVSKPICVAISTKEAIVYSMRGTLVSTLQFVDTSTIQSISGNKTFISNVALNGGMSVNTTVISVSAYSVQSSEVALLLAYSGGNQVITLPNSPVDGRTLEIKKIANTAYLVSLSSPGVNIDGSPSNYTFFNYNQAVKIRYCNTPSYIGWYIF